MGRFNKQDQYDKQKKHVGTARVLSIFWPFYNLYMKNIEGAVFSSLLLAVIYIVLDPLIVALLVHLLGTIILQDNINGSVADYNYKLYKRIFYVKTVVGGRHTPRSP